MEDVGRQGRIDHGLPAEVDVAAFPNITSVYRQAVNKFGQHTAFSSMGRELTFAEIDQLSGQFAAWIQNHTSLKPGDRIALQLPNILQYPVAMFGALRAGLVVVNTNPLYTAREMRHQFKDSGAKAIVILANMANLLEEVIGDTDIEHVVVTEIGDLLPPVKRVLVNTVVKYVKKMVPSFNLPMAKTFREVLASGQGLAVNEQEAQSDDIAVLQYTGGTTGVAKGAMLTHGNIVANMMQTAPQMDATGMVEGKEVLIAPLPLYHIYAFTIHCMVAFQRGCHSVLIANPRDIPGFVKELRNHKFSTFIGLNTLFIGLMNNEDFQKLDFSTLKLTMSGGMALSRAVAERWQAMTGCSVTEGYGMTETSPVACANPPNAEQLGTIGLPVPNTMVKVIDEDGNDLPLGETGELCINGPQVMKGYWQRPDATAEVLSDGWLRTGDMAIIQQDGFVKLVDRKKDMIIVSGFNVFPNELEDVLMAHDSVVECAAIGLPDEKSGEVIKMFVVSNDPNLSADDVRKYMRQNVTAYKVPRFVEFRDELPKTNVGKVLRRELRDAETNAS
ncbi:MAG: AMP-binding protein [Gammaproteobacteria bacterium]|nr:AMP-binding protein [Gammaproteobacteria bacterium]